MNYGSEGYNIVLERLDNKEVTILSKWKPLTPVTFHEKSVVPAIEVYSLYYSRFKMERRGEWQYKC